MGEVAADRIKVRPVRRGLLLEVAYVPVSMGKDSEMAVPVAPVSGLTCPP